ncbi:hypothetical protein JTB14_027811 [Gonioctena quinquepunctata]|nr:hypothetical protein JTB14_027811 [Gonioctena quinquepunctata]
MTKTDSTPRPGISGRTAPLTSELSMDSSENEARYDNFEDFSNSESECMPSCDSTSSASDTERFPSIVKEYTNSRMLEKLILEKIKLERHLKLQSVYFQQIRY